MIILRLLLVAWIIQCYYTFSRYCEKAPTNIREIKTDKEVQSRSVGVERVFNERTQIEDGEGDLETSPDKREKSRRRIERGGLFEGSRERYQERPEDLENREEKPSGSGGEAEDILPRDRTGWVS